MNEIVTAVISSLVVSGSLGYVNYVLLEKLGIISFDKSSNDEKKMVLLAFAALNYGLYLWVASYISGAENGNYKSIAVVIVIVAALDVILTPTLVAGGVVGAKYVINWIRNKFMKKSHVDSVLTRNDFFNTNKQQEIYIFDFDNKLISCGYLVYQGDAKLDYFDLNLMPFDVSESNITFENVVETASNKESRVLVDMEKHVKLYNIMS